MKWYVFLAIVSGVLGGIPAFAGDSDAQSGAIVQYGKMHEAIGQRQDQGRVRLLELTTRPHFYGVAALERLRGEVTIYDGKVTLTSVDENSRPHARAVSPEDQATMLVGAYVPAWTHHEVTEQVPAEKFDDTVERIASAAGLDVSRPFIFTIEGEFTDVRLHVINGTCPIHARMKKTELSEQSRPFEDELPKVSGKVVGVFAKDAVGNLTHPATSTHIHLLYTDLATGKMITGHLEQIGLQKGVTLSLPQK